MSKAKPPAVAPAIASDPELVRLEQGMRALQEQAESRMEEARALSREPVNLLDTADRFEAITNEVLRLIAQGEKLRQYYRRRRERLEAERARRVARARAAFLASDDSPPGSVRH
jgi:hypothetical protein